MARQFGSGSLGGDDSPWRLSSMISFPGRLVVALFVFGITSWSSSRHLKPFLLSLPAGAMLLVAIAAVTVPPWLLRLDNKRNDMYASRFAYYLTTPGHASHALACALRLAERNPMDTEYKFFIGQAQQVNGDMQAARRTMLSLAPVDAAGYSPAHVWLADYYLGLGMQEGGDLEGAKAEARRHLHWALQADDEEFTVDAANANLRLGQLYVLEKKYEDAIPVLERLIDQQWEYAAQLRAIPLMLEAVKGTATPERLETVFRRTLDKLVPLARRFTESIDIWHTLITACLRVDRFDMAQEFMEEALVLCRDPQVRMQLMFVKAELYVFHANSYTDFESESDYVARLKAAAQAVMVHSNQKNAFDILMPYVESYLLDAQRERLVRETMLDSETRPVIQILVGFAEAMRDNMTEAEKMWRIAGQSFPPAPNVVSNFAIVAANLPAPSFEKLEQVIKLARMVYVNNPVFDLAQAEVAIAKGEADTALALLEPILNEYPDAIQVHAVYLRALEKTNDQERIEQERELIRRMIEERQKLELK